MDKLLSLLGPAIDDPDEESFLLFSQSIPSNSLGFVHCKAEILEIPISGKDYAIHQSPGLLSSNRKEGTTGAVLWQVTPRFAEWMISDSNFLFTDGLLTSDSNVLELGCGVSGLLSLVVSPKVKSYIATDQSYVLKLLRTNLIENVTLKSSSKKSKKAQTQSKPALNTEDAFDNIIVKSLDWETDSVTTLYSDIFVEKGDQINAVIACDCIYNESLVDSFVNTCMDICRLSSSDSPTICIVAQQLRSPDVFDVWLTAFHKSFQTWRISENNISKDLGEDSGFVVHIGILRDK